MKTNVNYWITGEHTWPTIRISQAALAARRSDSNVTLEAVYDIPVQLSVVLGRTSMQVSQLLKLGRGAVVELDRKVGEPIDIFVNNRLIARGEVVVVEDRIGVTMTEIIKPEKSMTIRAWIRGGALTTTHAGVNGIRGAPPIIKDKHAATHYRRTRRPDRRSDENRALARRKSDAGAVD